MRLGIALFAAFAFVACASEDLPPELTGNSPSPGGDVTGTWAVAWGPQVGTNTYPDTLKDAQNNDSIVTRTVRDTCTATGTLNLTQHSPVAYVTGPYAVTRTCTSHLLDSNGNDSVLVGTVVTTPADSVRHANMGSGVFSFTLDKAVTARELQLGLVSGASMNGTSRWTIFMATRPTKGRGTVAGLFTATKQ